MAILNVDRDPLTRHAIRNMLKSAYSGVMIETKDFTEAARVLEQNKTKIRYIICGLLKEDQSETNVFSKIKNQPVYDSIPTIGLVSHSLIFWPKTFSKVRFRIDAYLKRPFTTQSLHQALKVASIERLKSRYTLGYIGPATSANAVAIRNIAKSEKLFLKELEVFENIRDLAGKPESTLRKLSAVLIDSSSVTPKEAEALNQFRRTPQGQKITFISIGRDPKKVGPIRDQAELFLPFEEFENIKQMKIVENFLISQWELDHNLQLMKQASQLKDSENLTLSRRLIERAPFYVHGYLQYASQLEQKNKLSLAKKEYEKAIEVNPFSPRAYLKLILLLQKENTPAAELKKWVSMAVDHCPAHPELQLLRKNLFDSL